MPADRRSSPQSAADPIQIQAAALFAVAARTPAEIDGGARLHCLAASQQLTSAVSLNGPQALLSRPDPADTRDAETLVRDALKLLGSLTLEEFAARNVRAAAEHGQCALRRLP